MDKKKQIVELSFPVFLALLGIFIVVVSFNYGSEGIFPRMVGGGLTLSSLGLIIKIIKNKAYVTNFEGKNIKNVASIVLALLAYIFLFNSIGYIISTFILAAFVIYQLGYRNIVVNLIVSAAATGVVFVIFKILLKVSLPVLFLNI